MASGKQPQQEQQNASDRKQDESKGRKSNTSTQELDKMLEETNESRTKKPGSQSTGGSGRHNNGRGGGK